MNTFEAVYPFLTFRALTAYIEHVIIELAQLEESLRYSSSPKPGAKDILIAW